MKIENDIYLKPCPFCGGKAYFLHGRKNECITCEECGHRFYSLEIGEDAQKELWKQWNSRPIEEALQEENLKLRAVVNFYADRKKYKTIIKGDNGEDENFMLRECGRYARNVLWQLERNRENEK